MHYTYGTVKISRSSGIIAMKTNTKGVVHCAEKLYEMMT